MRHWRNICFPTYLARNLVIHGSKITISFRRLNFYLVIVLNAIIKIIIIINEIIHKIIII